MNLRSILLASATLLAFGCSKEHEACLSVADEAFVCPGIAIDFKNCGPADDTYNWNFGDGTGSKKFEETHTFTEIDTFTVYLAAGTGKRAVRDSLVLHVKLPVGLELTLLSIPANAPDGQTWDPNGGGPDLRLWIFDEFGSTIYNTDLVNNVSVPADFGLGDTELCRTCTWDMLLLDSQGGSDYDTVWSHTASYTELASKRAHSYTAASGATVELRFAPH